MSVRELIAELALLQDQITQTAARAGYSPPPLLQPAEPVSDLPHGRPQVHQVDQASVDTTGSALGVIEALDLLEALKHRERTVLAELHYRAHP